jgi:hypothetical protein
MGKASRGKRGRGETSAGSGGTGGGAAGSGRAEPLSEPTLFGLTRKQALAPASLLIASLIGAHITKAPLWWTLTTLAAILAFWRGFSWIRGTRRPGLSVGALAVLYVVGSLVLLFYTFPQQRFQTRLASANVVRKHGWAGTTIFFELSMHELLDLAEGNQVAVSCGAVDHGKHINDWFGAGSPAVDIEDQVTIVVRPPREFFRQLCLAGAEGEYRCGPVLVPKNGDPRRPIANTWGQNNPSLPCDEILEQ